MDYIKYIRNIVGHKEIMAIGVAILVLNEKDEVLLETRSDNDKYSFPGGALNMGEKVKAGAIRETFEETGIHFEEDEIKLLGVFSGEEGRMEYPNQDVTYYTDIIFIGRVDSKKVNIVSQDGESKEIKFVPFDKIDFDNCLRMDQRVLKSYFINKNRDIVVD